MECDPGRLSAPTGSARKPAIASTRRRRLGGWRRLGWGGLLLLSWGVASALEAVDDGGDLLRLATPATRIVSLSPHTTELLFAVGAGGQVVGAAFSDYPPAALALPAVGGAAGLDLEAILALRPDLVVAWGGGNPPAALATLRRLQLPLFVSEPQGLEGIASSLERLGRLTGHTSDGATAAAAFRQRVAELERRFAQRPPLRVFYQLWHQPPMTLGGGHLMDAVIRLCGGNNLFADLGTLAGTVSLEGVIARDPQVIVASGSGAERPAWLDDWRRWPAISAVQYDNLFAIPPDLLQRPTPRLLDGAEQLCNDLELARRRLTTAPSTGTQGQIEGQADHPQGDGDP